MTDLAVPARFDTEPWQLPVGIAEDDLGTAVLEVYDGEHVLVAGPARSGKSSVLLALAAAARSADGVKPAVWGICDRRSPLANALEHGTVDRLAVGADEVPALLAGIRLERGPVLLLIDDAERFDDGDQGISSLLATERPGLCVVAAGRSADLRSLYSHWTRAVRKARCGVLLQPDVDYDGEAPRRHAAPTITGRADHRPGVRGLGRRGAARADGLRRELTGPVPGGTRPVRAQPHPARNRQITAGLPR